MGFQESTGFCEHCNRQVMVRRKTANHILHFLLTIFLGAISFGILGVLWLFMWFYSAKFPGKWLCTVCGRVADHGEKTDYRGMWDNIEDSKKNPEPETTTKASEPDDDQPNVYVIK
ncbi:hypothetical protein DSCO28_07770 [Desulfosarcina ovata subsp. sediminis]|uniref:LITAF domain-containing protein n=1 Tax=Desulfosarcina ovata subsp. sediminis TaxID=885957 RepID=A0A5K7ZH75_9BACT|nr:hypothetical protein [Desulfosarcina ovata]BBO80211.1 hypothetical protein DSCO28_07770 [Desulfosarcina ovata subsp. sediminis]